MSAGHGRLLDLGEGDVGRLAELLVEDHSDLGLHRAHGAVGHRELRPRQLFVGQAQLGFEIGDQQLDVELVAITQIELEPTGLPGLGERAVDRPRDRTVGQVRPGVGRRLIVGQKDWIVGRSRRSHRQPGEGNEQCGDKRDRDAASAASP